MMPTFCSMPSDEHLEAASTLTSAEFCLVCVCACVNWECEYKQTRHTK